jgi:ERF superfamily
MKNLVTALIEAQKAFLPIKKDKDNPFFHSKYADLESVIDGIKKALSDNGLAVIQTFGISEGKTTLLTTLLHTSGEFFRGEQFLDVAGDPQKIASASTYARRYGLLAILGIAAEDDDGNTASLPKKEEVKSPAQASMEAQKPIVDKFDIDCEILGTKYNADKKRSEYEVVTEDQDHYVVYIKKPLITTKERQKVILRGFREWMPDPKKPKLIYYLADDISIPVPTKKIPF